MADGLTFILAMTCVLPAIAGVIRFRKISSSYYPFVFLMMLDVAMEIVIRVYRDEALPFCIYVILNFGVFLYFVFLSEFIGKRAFLFFLLSVAIAIVNFFFYDTVCKPFINDFTTVVLLRSIYLLCFTGIIMLFIVIDILSKQISAINMRLLNNPWFWIGGAYTLSISFNLLIFSLYIFAVSNSPNGKSIGNIHHYINALCYFFFLIGVLKIPAIRSDLKTDTLPRKLNEYAGF